MNLIFTPLNIQSVQFRSRNEKGIPGSQREIDLGRYKKKIQVPALDGQFVEVERRKNPSSLNILSVTFKNKNEKGIPGSRREIDLGRSKKKIQVLKEKHKNK
uniref:Uncharacterized protein n=1 Tax=Sipha flava TaxID=143950 RepID=A0A2S2PZM7_9HEMI